MTIRWRSFVAEGLRASAVAAATAITLVATITAPVAPDLKYVIALIILSGIVGFLIVNRVLFDHESEAGMALDAPQRPQEDVREVIKSEIAALTLVGAIGRVAKALAIVEARSTSLIHRLESHLRRIEVNGKISLAIGASATILAVGILVGFIVLDMSSTVTVALPATNHALTSAEIDNAVRNSVATRYAGIRVSERVMTLAPRIAVALLIEAFALFFLNLYKYSLVETKYFHNEISNVEQHRMALCLAVVGEAGILPDVIKTVAAVDRNAGQLSSRATDSQLREKAIETLMELLTKALAK